MSAYRCAVVVYLLAVLALPVAWVAAQTRGKGAIRRAEPPKFGSTDPFFADAFTDALRGERPGNLGQAVVAKSTSGDGGNTTTVDPADANEGSGWAAIISSTALEDEIKAQKLMAEANVTTPSEFAGSGYKAARRDFSVVAMVFGIIGEYDGEVRWQKEAPSQRDLFARTANNAKVGTTGVYNEAKLRKQDLGDLIGGQGVETREAEAKAKWGDLLNRTPLMQRLEASNDSKIKAWSASTSSFNENLEKLQHEAQIFAAIGAILQEDSMQDGDDEEYKKFAQILLAGGKALTQACKDKNQDAASKAASIISSSCSNCHDSYR